VGAPENVLIVEDEEEWGNVYVRAAAASASLHAVKLAADLASAEQLVEAAKFAVAFVDIGLDVSDDRNVDGLRVMEKIRAVGDETSIIVVTGRSGQDVLAITRDAIKKYYAFDTLGKSTVRPSDIRKLLEDGLEAYRNATVRHQTAARDALRGGVNASMWDDRAMRALAYKGDVRAFYSFLGRLIDEYLPIIPRRMGDCTIVDPERRLLYGAYWSRAIGTGIGICVGASGEYGESVLMGTGIIGANVALAPLKELDGPEIRGGVFAMDGNGRDAFRGC
jgi:CheY-like chemotaxis protein